MNTADKPRTLSIRSADDILAHVEDFRSAQLAKPSQTEALRVLVRMGFEKWKCDQAALERH
jgi:hypothetical protein